MSKSHLAVITVPILLSLACAVETGPAVQSSQPPDRVVAPAEPTRIERITAAVPWPRGVRFLDGKLYVVARGVHRSAGGPQADIDDQAGAIFVVDPDVFEPAEIDRPVGAAVRENAEVIATPTQSPFRLWNRVMPATDDTLTDRPYCMLAYDDASQNFFVCGYSGIDLPKPGKFRKNATDSVHRFDLRTRQWSCVEAHDPSIVPVEALGYDVDSRYYPHHDTTTNPPPHGLVNGPCGAVVAGDFLYVGAKDNTALAQYDLREIRRDPNAPAPPARYVFEGSAGDAFVEVEGRGRTRLNGACALAVDGDHLYVAFRTTSQIVRFPLRENGDVVEPLVAEQVAQFARYDPAKDGGSANIYDIEFNDGWLYVSPGYDGAIYRFKPDPDDEYDAENVAYEPFVDLSKLGAKKSGNICFDDQGNLYVCSGQAVLEGSRIRGVIYRVRAQP